MRIAILTQPLKTNYGGILQAWALQQVLTRLGHTPITIDRQYNRRARLATVPGKAKRFLQDAVLATRGQTLYQRHLTYICARQSAFIRQNILLSPTIQGDAELYQYFQKNKFDAVVVGSDQVWRPCYSPNIESYFLNFVDALNRPPPKRLAYGASFGVDHWEFSPEQTKICSEMAQRFDAISVRESSAIQLSRENLGVAAELVADPTLLLDKEDYIRSFCPDAKSAAKGVFTYILDEDDFKKNVVSEVERQLGMERFSQQPRPSQRTIVRRDISGYQFPPTDSWLRGFQEAKYVVTDSFHGTVMSLIFEKPFIAIANSARGAARFQSLLSLVGLENRLISKSEEFEADKLIEPVDFSEVRSKLDTLRASSIAFLGKHL
ncbi:polysaccharide pyruvyl transferase family protein [Halomonas sp. MC140]|nr:polysaccharide pyruvyl transferase family protein [Halomonas sp. MC140]MDN7131508.1 polysaccharide pyruvyl transferase family protein [Halomonas sp. MC140]